MSSKFRLALVEELSKLAGQMPGVLSPAQPFGLTETVRRNLGIVGKRQRGLPGMVGTMSVGPGPGTIGGGVPKGMGEHESSKPPPTSSEKISAILPPLPNIKPVSGPMMPPKPSLGMPPLDSMIPKVSLGSAYPTPEDALRALGEGADLDLAYLASKEASRTRLMGTLEALDELYACTSPADMAPALMKLAEIRKEAWASHALRTSGGLGSRMMKNKAFWKMPGAAGKTPKAAKKIAP